jgi:putative transposase
MRRRRNADEVARLLREADRGPAKGLTISDFCRKQGIAETTYCRWRQRDDPGQVDSDRRCRELELEVDRLKRLVAELLLDETDQDTHLPRTKAPTFLAVRTKTDQRTKTPTFPTFLGPRHPPSSPRRTKTPTFLAEAERTCITKVSVR